MNTHHISAAFDSQECNELSRALDLAWTIFLRTGRLTAANLDTARGALALAILDRAARGESNVHRLAISAVHRFDEFEARVRARSSAHAA